MYEQRELFKDLLRDHQIPVFDELLNAGNKTLLKAPMDFGKTFIACAYVSYFFQIKRIGSATFSIPNYEMRKKIIDDLHRVGLKDKLIVIEQIIQDPVQFFHKFAVFHHLTSGERIKFPCSSSRTFT